MQTCHRAEAYVSAEDEESADAALKQYTDKGDKLEEKEAILHLMQTAAGLKSVVIGEDQIQGQVSKAYEKSREKNAIGGPLEKIILKSIKTGKKVRNKTRINEGVKNIPGAAVRLAKGYKPLADKNVLLVGAGETIELTAQHLDQKVRQITIANRTLKNAETINEQLKTDAKLTDLDKIPRMINKHDVMITATGSEYHLFHPHHFKDCSEIHVIDLAQPRDVDPITGEIVGVKLENLEDVKNLVQEHEARRENQITEARNIIENEYRKTREELDNRDAEETIRKLHVQAHQKRREQVNKAHRELKNGASIERVIEELSTSLTETLLREPVQKIRNEEENQELIKIAEELYNI